MVDAKNVSFLFYHVQNSFYRILNFSGSPDVDELTVAKAATENTLGSPSFNQKHHRDQSYIL